MDLRLVETLFSDLFQGGRLASSVTVVWHSGEPLTLPPSYYDDAITLITGLQESFGAAGIALRFAIQTNAVLIDDEWCAFFKRHAHRLDLGVSCDGPADLHDAWRVGWNGRGTHARTVRGMDLLQQHGIKYKLIAVVTSHTLQQPEKFYEFFFNRRAHLSGFHFNLLAESSATNPALAFSADDRAAYYAFYRRLLELDRASVASGGPFEILNFALIAERILAAEQAAPAFVDQATAPLKSLNVDARGNITTFYAGLANDVLPDVYGDGEGFALGNIFGSSLEEMVRSQKLQDMTQDFMLSRHSCEASCEYFNLCPGGYEILKKKVFGTFEASETVECLIHVKTLVDAVVDDINERAESGLETSSSNSCMP
jgi:uncharacterized protein